jgi:ABC-type antimicrobial peptide transport system permease subunit
MRLMLIGLAIGLASMVPVSDVLSAMLYGVGTYDVPTIAVVAALLALVGGLASVLPAVRMTKGDPLEALRYR